MMRWMVPLLLLFGSCTESQVSYHALVVDPTTEADSLMGRWIAPYRDSLETTMGHVLVNSQNTMGRGRPDSPLGSLIADLILEEARQETAPGEPMPEFCIINIGGLRIDLPEGDVEVRHVFELMPFENRLSFIRLTPKGMQGMIDYFVTEGGQPVSGLRVEVKDSVTIAVTVNGRPLEERSYVVVTSDYLADGGDRMYFLADNAGRTDLQLTVRDAIIRNFQQKGTASTPLVPPIDRRIIIDP
ncbi:MAG: 5'-nucleotidase C-terminal domain-containing protein [Flavobacteriales bacterium]|nr:5'-nucleotidase C-terminal domain-containing protein [Flavobacteriales bacterium]